jgi:hypothetical protein
MSETFVDRIIAQVDQHLDGELSGFVITAQCAGIAISTLRQQAGDIGKKAIERINAGDEDKARWYARWAASLGNACIAIDTAPYAQRLRR